MTEGVAGHAELSLTIAEVSCDAWPPVHLTTSGALSKTETSHGPLAPRVPPAGVCNGAKSNAQGDHGDGVDGQMKSFPNSLQPTIDVCSSGDELGI
mmetsp:Transcript_147047/g.366787  ORF Transcript_147047/g.366787 Transcript_147047/m.366787 type:complete len:96 (-) Transcript_147047:1179-1466(-)|eukprot:CAMPEP_0115362432 /NCGR_PEP_ID=MMETSP0270-20121206/102703_1 /TAXON_ID=71861 /ORGANISM="Scrippsiella trochoidea, Strain CCMP3099" /LENGTH=95 /DNA_ID=CAMNT_0002785005 /DNA_START=815 /DNA_END=1102 /DNA_ORIENTATION=-